MDIKTNQEKLSPLENLLQHSGSEHYKEVITEFWESWLTNSDNDCCDCIERSDKLSVWKHLIKYFDEIEQDRNILKANQN